MEMSNVNVCIERVINLKQGCQYSVTKKVWELYDMLDVCVIAGRKPAHAQEVLAGRGRFFIGG